MDQDVQSAQVQSIIEIIKNDHKILKEAIEVLTRDSSSESNRKSVLKKFLIDLKLHAKSEELSLYDQAVNKEKIHDLILEGYEEHALADLLGDELIAVLNVEGLSDEIHAKARVLAELVKHHLREEEEEVIAKLKDCFSQEELENLGTLYQKTYRVFQDELKNPKFRGKKNPDLMINFF